MANTFKSFTKASVSTSLTTIYTCPSSTTTIVIGIALANKLTGGSTVYGSIYISKYGAPDDIYMIRDAALYPGSLLTVADTGKIILQEFDAVKVITDSTNSTDVILSVLEQT